MKRVKVISIETGRVIHEDIVHVHDAEIMECHAAMFGITLDISEAPQYTVQQLRDNGQVIEQFESIYFDIACAKFKEWQKKEYRVILEKR